MANKRRTYADLSYTTSQLPSPRSSCDSLLTLGGFRATSQNRNCVGYFCHPRLAQPVSNAGSAMSVLPNHIDHPKEFLKESPPHPQPDFLRFVAGRAINPILHRSYYMPLFFFPCAATKEEPPFPHRTFCLLSFRFLYASPCTLYHPASTSRCEYRLPCIPQVDIIRARDILHRFIVSKAYRLGH